MSNLSFQLPNLPGHGYYFITPPYFLTFPSFLPIAILLWDINCYAAVDDFELSPSIFVPSLPKRS